MTTTATRTIIDSPVGPLSVASQGRELFSVAFTEQPSAAELRGAANPYGVGALRAYFDGDLDAIASIEVDGRGTQFQRTVWAALRQIPAGHTWSYAELAEYIGQPSATRAVGTANGANPIAIVVPCHRVIATGGGLGGYAGGLDRKTWLLQHEGAILT